MRQPLLLDLFCGAGGAGVGYARAGFRLVGCDLDPKPLRHNPHECYVGDALAVLDTLLAGEAWHGYQPGDFAAIHASPVCKDYTPLAALHVRGKYPRLIVPVRERLERTGLPWVIENVASAWVDMQKPMMLCGSMFGLRVRRHRLFESNYLLWKPSACRHTEPCISVHGDSVWDYSQPGTPRKDGRRRPAATTTAVGRVAMGIPWMTQAELAQAIPPAYTHWLGRQLITAIGGMAA